ncbi:MAG TPA: hypothetical protein VFJ64_09550 [Solirubrobacterales bacterium]|nr:hypothetical protein [Solirubrobacterales bacterium]
MASLAWTSTVVVTALAGAAKAGANMAVLALIAVVGIALVVVIAAFGLLARPSGD